MLNKSDITANTLAMIRNTRSDLMWYAARLAWFYWSDNFGNCDIEKRFVLIGRVFSNPGSVPQDLKCIYQYDDHLNTLTNNERAIETVRRIWCFLHSLDEKLAQHDRMVESKSSKTKFAYPSVYESRWYNK